MTIRQMLHTDCSQKDYEVERVSGPDKNGTAMNGKYVWKEAKDWLTVNQKKGKERERAMAMNKIWNRLMEQYRNY